MNLISLIHISKFKSYEYKNMIKDENPRYHKHVLKFQQFKLNHVLKVSPLPLL